MATDATTEVEDAARTAAPQQRHHGSDVEIGFQPVGPPGVALPLVVPGPMGGFQLRPALTGVFLHAHDDGHSLGLVRGCAGGCVRKSGGAGKSVSVSVDLGV